MESSAFTIIHVKGTARAVKQSRNVWTPGPPSGYFPMVRATDIQPIGPELAIKWEDGREDFILLEQLRRCCPCAGCMGETDIMGNVYKNPSKPLTANAFQIMRLDYVGGYAIQPVWGDGHNTGIFSFDYLKKVAAQS